MSAPPTPYGNNAPQGSNLQAGRGYSSPPGPPRTPTGVNDFARPQGTPSATTPAATPGLRDSQAGRGYGFPPGPQRAGTGVSEFARPQGTPSATTPAAAPTTPGTRDSQAGRGYGFPPPGPSRTPTGVSVAQGTPSVTTPAVTPGARDSQAGRGYGFPPALSRAPTGVSNVGTNQGNTSATATTPLAQSMLAPQTPLSQAPDQRSTYREDLASPQLQTAETSTLHDGTADNVNAENVDAEHINPDNGSVENGGIDNGTATGLERTSSRASTAVPATTPSRSGTLKKGPSIARTFSMKRSGSKRSIKAGSIKGIEPTDDTLDYNSVFHTPIPTTGAPTDVLANRFQAWRQLLKTLISYFREIQNSYDQRAKALNKVQNTIANISTPSSFMSDGGIGEATRILVDYHRHSIAEANKSRDIENDVVGALTGLRSDLGQKIKEIKSLSGDFKNSVNKEQDSTRRAVDGYQDTLQHLENESANAGKNDPYLMRLGVDRCVERQIDEENYLHRAHLNLESSGRELESIVVGEIQKAYNAFAGILKREGDDAYSVVETLRTGPISMAKDLEWKEFVENDPHFINPELPLRQLEQMEYPGKDNPAASEVRAGMLERKSKYLKSYTPGWYVLSPTHLHEFKSADKIFTQPPVMSLYLPEQKLGSKSEGESSSHKFMLKGKQSSGMHRGHNWVFRAESNETMLAWYEAIKALTEKTGEERTAYVRQHARSVSGNSAPSIGSSDGMDEDEADKVPYSADAASLSEQNPLEEKTQRPQPGGRFPSDMNAERRDPMSNSDDSSETDAAIAASSGMPGSGQQEYEENGANPYALDGMPAGAAMDQRSQYELENGKPPHEEIADRNIAADHPPGNFDPVPGPGTQQPVPSPYHEPNVMPPQQSRNPFDRFHGAAAAMPGRGPQQPEPRNYNSSPFQSMDEPLADMPPPEPHRPNTQQPFYRHNNSYANWLGPGGPGAVAGPLGGAPYNPNRNNPNNAPVAVGGPASTPGPFGRGPPFAPAGTFPGAPYYPSRTNTGLSNTDLSNNRLSDNRLSDNGLSGQEKEGARETGNIMPPVLRHDTDMSVDQLHVPGEFPGQSQR